MIELWGVMSFRLTNSMHFTRGIKDKGKTIDSGSKIPL